MRWLTTGACVGGLLALAVVASAPASAQEKKGKKVASSLKVGDPAPKFTSVDDQGKPFQSSDVVGKKTVVIFFFPAALTGGWTKQACGFRDEIDELKAKGVVVLGVSGDSVANQKLFKDVHDLNYTLLADDKGEVAKAFGIKTNPGGVFKFKDKEGKVHELKRGVTIPRTTVVIDKAGNIAAVDAVGNAGGDAQRVAEIVKNLEKWVAGLLAQSKVVSATDRHDDEFSALGVSVCGCSAWGAPEPENRNKKACRRDHRR